MSSTEQAHGQDLVSKVADEMRRRFLGEGTGHDWHHLDRVRRTALTIAKKEQGTGLVPDLTLVELGALLHDIADWKFTDGDTSIGPRQATELLYALGADEKTISAVAEIVEHVSFKGAQVETPMNSIEGKIVQDADRLDALGAVGLARCFAYGGAKGRALYDPDLKPVLHTSANDYITSVSTCVNHFHEKIYFLRDRMNTQTGRAMAEDRHAFVQCFEKQFLSEWFCEEPFEERETV